jgi:hypothetical protein
MGALTPFLAAHSAQKPGLCEERWEDAIDQMITQKFVHDEE